MGILTRGKASTPEEMEMAEKDRQTARAKAALNASIPTAYTEHATETVEAWARDGHLEGTIHGYIKPKTSKQHQALARHDQRRRTAAAASLHTQTFEMEMKDLDQTEELIQALQEADKTIRKEAPDLTGDTAAEMILMAAQVEFGLDLDHVLMCGCTIGHVLTTEPIAADIGIAQGLMHHLKAQQAQDRDQAAKGHLGQDRHWAETEGPWAEGLEAYRQGEAKLRDKTISKKARRQAQRTAKEGLRQIREIALAQGLDLSIKDIEIQIKANREPGNPREFHVH